MDSQRLIAFVVFSFSLLMLWNAWQEHTHPKEVTVASSAATSGRAVAPDATLPPTPGQELKGPVAPVSTNQVVKGARVKVETDVLTAVIDANGGDIREMEFSKYRENENANLPFRLFEEEAGHNYFAQSGLLGTDMPNHKTVFTLDPGDYRLKEGQNQIRVSMKATSVNAEVVKTYLFTRGSYVVDVEIRIKNLGHTPLDAYPYYQYLRNGLPPEGESKMVNTFTGPAIYTDANKYQKVKFTDIEKGKQDHVKQAKDGWIGMVQHHFFSAWLTLDPNDASAREFYTRALGNGEYSAGVIMPDVKLVPGEEKTTTMRLYAGPQDVEKIEQLAPGLKLVVDYGWLKPIAYPIFALLNWLHGLVTNWGTAIILLTVLIKLAFYPLSAASYKSMAKMRKLAPRLEHLKERYGDDRQKLHEAMMKVYSEEKINPLGGCLPIVIQIPVFISLYWVLLGTVELRQAPFALWIHDLSKPDPFYVLPVIMAISSFIQMKMSPKPTDPVQAKVMMIMPIAFSVMFLFFPAGLVLYWLVNNVLSILQQWRINQVVASGSGAANDSKH